MTYLHGFDGAVGLEIAAVHQIVVIHVLLVGTGEPCGTACHVRVDQVAQRVTGLGRVLGLLSVACLRAKRHRSDVAL